MTKDRSIGNAKKEPTEKRVLQEVASKRRKVFHGGGKHSIARSGKGDTSESNKVTFMSHRVAEKSEIEDCQQPLRGIGGKSED